MKVIAAIDQGTTSSRCILFDQQGKIIGSSQKEHTQIFPQPGWVEHDPEEIWKNICIVVQSALEQSNIKSNQVHSIGIANQRETTVLWNKKTGLPYMNAIVWQDTRTDKLCNSFINNFGKEYFQLKTGLPISTYFSGMKIKWMLENLEDVTIDLKRGEVLFGTIDTWLLWNLTGGVNGGIHVTDVTNASRTMLMNLASCDWDDSILDSLNIPREILPQIKPSSSLIGESSCILKGIPIGGVLGDQQGALFGQTCFMPGEAKNTYGTGCFLLLNTGENLHFSRNGLLSTIGYQIGNTPPTYCLEGSVAITGALVQWLRDNLGIISDSREIESLAQSVENNGNVYFVPAFSGLYAPYWRSDARGLIIGLTRYSNKGHIARAALEASAYQSWEILNAMIQDTGIELKELKVDGGMVVNEILMQFQSDLLGVPVIRPTIKETTALGAAFAAGLATGFWQDLDELKQFWKKDKQWTPKMGEDIRDNYKNKWKKAVRRTFDWESV